MTIQELATLEKESKSMLYTLVLKFIKEEKNKKIDNVYKCVRDNEDGSSEPKYLACEIKALDEILHKLEVVSVPRKIENNIV